MEGQYQQFLFTVQYKNTKKFVPHSVHTGLNNFLNSCCEKFGINEISENLELISTKDNVVLEEGEFELFLYLNKDAAFNLVIKGEEKAEAEAEKFGDAELREHQVSTPRGDRLKTYLVDHNVVIIEGQALTDAERRKVINISCDFMCENFGYHPSKEIRIDIAKQIVKLFPCLHSGTELGYEIVYDPTTGGGFLGWRLKTVNKHRIQLLEPTKKKDEVSIIEELPVPVIKDREEILSFLEDAEKILNHFNTLFPNVDFKLVDSWESIKENTNKVLAEKDLQVFLKWKNEDIDVFTKLIALLPTKGKPKKGASTGIDRVFVFKKTSESIEGKLKELQEGNSNHPLILCSGLDYQKITSFYLVIDGTLGPQSPDPVQAFDLLFKAYFVFDIEYDGSLKNFFYLFQKYIFKINDTKIKASARLKEIGPRIAAGISSDKE